MGEQAPEKDGAEIALARVGRVERFDSMPEAIEGLREQAEPVAWQYRSSDGERWTSWDECSEALYRRVASRNIEREEVRKLYTHPPASSKEADGCEGLREALEKIAAGKEMATIIARNALAAQEQK